MTHTKEKMLCEAKEEEEKRGIYSLQKRESKS